MYRNTAIPTETVKKSNLCTEVRILTPDTKVIESNNKNFDYVKIIEDVDIVNKSEK